LTHGKESFFTALIGRWNDEVRRLKNGNDVDKIEAMLFKV